tara:strand:+ start:436 stop:714 length:279 start_codon:yes stop_codon:yes gene_type:complete
MYPPPPRWSIAWNAYFERVRVEAMVENLRKCISNPSHKNLKRCVNDACRRSDAQALTFLDSQLESLKAHGRVDAEALTVMDSMAQNLEATLN